MGRSVRGSVIDAIKRVHDAMYFCQAASSYSTYSAHSSDSQPSVGILRDFDGLELLVVLGRLDVLDAELGH
jgi:hypothetical protein